jgi:hypothetical protein
MASMGCLNLLFISKREACCTPVTAVVIFLSLRPRNTGHGSLPSWWGMGT